RVAAILVLQLRQLPEDLLDLLLCTFGYPTDGREGLHQEGRILRLLSGDSLRPTERRASNHSGSRWIPPTQYVLKTKALVTVVQEILHYLLVGSRFDRLQNGI